jgi:hypothetical protein
MAETGAMTATQAVPPPRKHRHRYHEVLAPNHKLRRAVTALAIGNIRKRREAATGGHGGKARVTDGCCDANQKPRSHDTSRIAWAKLMARVGEEFPLECPGCGGDIRLIAFRLLSECETIPGHPWPSHSWQPPVAADFLSANPGPIRKVLTHLGEPLEPPPVSPARGPPTDWGELVQVHFRPGNLSGVARRAARNRHPQPLTAFHATVRTAREQSGFKAGLRQREKPGLERG